MKKILFIFFIFSLLLILSTCFFAGNSTVSVSPEIRAIGLPSNITSTELTVSGPGMNTIIVSYEDLPSSIEISVPSGNERTFELVVYVDDPVSAATSFKGTATADLSQGNADVTLSMELGSTKLIVPDFNNNRLLQFDDINDNTAEILTAASLPVGLLYAYDVDFDNQGRIYIANNDFTDGGFIRINDITGLTDTIWKGTGHGAVVALTVDRKSNFVYFATGIAIFRSDLDGTADVPLTINAGIEPIVTIRGMATSDDGFIYLAGATTSGVPRVFKYDPVSQLVITTYSLNLNTPWDVMVKSDSIYVANLNGADNSIIIKLDKSLNLEQGYGINSITGLADTVQNNFYGAYRFIAILNKKITILDEDPNFGTNLDKLISIDDITGANWDTLPEGSDDGQSLFRFYNYC